MKKLSWILIISGIIIVLIPIVGQLYTSYKENKAINDWLSNMQEPLQAQEELSNAEADFNSLQQAFSEENNTTEQIATNSSASNSSNKEGDDAIAIQSTLKPKPTPKPKPKPSPQIIIGLINIKKIKVKSPIVEGVGTGNLKAGVGHIPGTAMPGKDGNSALAGHRSYTFGRFFNRLDELKNGDEIIITTKSKDYKYKVYEKLVVKPNDVSVLKKDKEKSNIITLITCTPIYVASHRLIVKAELVE